MWKGLALLVAVAYCIIYRPWHQNNEYVLDADFCYYSDSEDYPVGHNCRQPRTTRVVCPSEGICKNGRFVGCERGYFSIHENKHVCASARGPIFFLVIFLIFIGFILYLYRQLADLYRQLAEWVSQLVEWVSQWFY